MMRLGRSEALQKWREQYGSVFKIFQASVVMQSRASGHTWQVAEAMPAMHGCAHTYMHMGIRTYIALSKIQQQNSNIGDWLIAENKSNQGS